MTQRGEQMVLNKEQPTLQGYMERIQGNLPALARPTAGTPERPKISQQAQAIIDKVDRASVMLAQATNDYERLYVRNQAQAAMDVAVQAVESGRHSQARQRDGAARRARHRQGQPAEAQGRLTPPGQIPGRRNPASTHREADPAGTQRHL